MFHSSTLNYFKAFVLKGSLLDSHVDDVELLSRRNAVSIDSLKLNYFQLSKV